MCEQQKQKCKGCCQCDGSCSAAPGSSFHAQVCDTRYNEALTATGGRFPPERADLQVDRRRTQKLLNSTHGQISLDVYLHIAKSSNCGSDVWHDEISDIIVQPVMTLLNVGANKGYGIQRFLQRYRTLKACCDSVHSWFLEVCNMAVASPSGAWRTCGACLDCAQEPPRRVQQVSHATAHAFELLNANAMLLGRLFSRFGVDGRVHHVAMGAHTNMSAFEPAAELSIPTGDERWSAGNSKSTVPVATMTLDTFARSQQLKCTWRLPNVNEGAGAGAARLHGLHVLIDTEGWDALVLEGAEELLRRRHIDLLEFEYNGMGAWQQDSPIYGQRRRLHGVLRSLGRHGYECFFQGTGQAISSHNKRVMAQLAPVSGQHWRPQYEHQGWSNLVCTHWEPVLKVMRRLSRIQLVHEV